MRTPQLTKLATVVGLIVGSAGFMQSKAYKESHSVQVIVSLAHIAPAAARGLLGLSSQWNGAIDDIHRNRVHKMKLNREVLEVNLACYYKGIPLTAILADLFILQHYVNAPHGSSLDYAFESMLINTFEEEFKEGIDLLSENLSALKNDGHPEMEAELAVRVNAFNKAGTIAHGIYREQKYIWADLMKNGLMPVHEERYSRNEKISSRKHHNNKQIAHYIAKINEVISSIEHKVEDRRAVIGWEPHCADEIEYRNALVFEYAEEIKGMRISAPQVSLFNQSQPRKNSAEPSVEESPNITPSSQR